MLQGHAIGNLKKEDFQLTDNGKPQVITKFSMEQSGAKPATKPRSGEEPLDDDATLKLPLRYVIFLFDDIHLKAADLAHVRDAVKLNVEACSPRSGSPSSPRPARRSSTSPTTATNSGHPEPSAAASDHRLWRTGVPGRVVLHGGPEQNKNDASGESADHPGDFGLCLFDGDAS